MAFSGWGGITGEINKALEEKKRKEEEEKQEAARVREQFLAAQEKELARREAEKAKQDAKDQQLREEYRALTAAETQRKAQEEERRASQFPSLRSYGEPEPRTPTRQYDLGDPVGYSRPSVDTSTPSIGSSRTYDETVTSDVRTPEPRRRTPTDPYVPQRAQPIDAGEGYQQRRSLYEPAARAPEPPRDRQAIRDEVYRTGQPQGPSWLEQGAQWLGEQAQAGANWLGDQPLGQRAAAGLDYLQNRYGENPQPGVLQEFWRNTPAYRYAQEQTEQRRREAGMPGIAASMRVAGAAVNEMGDVVPGARAAGATMGAVGGFFNRLGQTELGQEVHQRGMDVLDRVLDVPQTVLTDTRIPGTDFSLTEAFQPVGERLNQNYNPFNPNRNQNGLGIWVDTLSMIANPNAWAVNISEAASPEFDRVRQAVADAAKENPDAILAERNLIGGPEAVQRSLNLIMNQDQMVQEELQKARQAENNGDATTAARHLAEAERLRKLTPVEMIQENMNPWAEVVRGIFADPAAAVTPFLPLIMEGTKVRKAGQLFNIAPDEVVRRLEPLTNPKRYQEATRLGSETAQQVWNAYVKPYQGVGDKVMQWTWLLDRPASSKAELDANAVFTGVTTILRGFNNKEDVRTILGTLAQEPLRLVTDGLNNLTGARGQAPQKWGPGLVANQEFVKRFPIVQAVADRIGAMPMLQGSGPMTANEIQAFQAGLYELYYDASKRFNGAFTPLLPLASAKADLVRMPDGTGVLRYLNKAGESIYDTAPMPYKEAQEALRRVKADTQAGILRTAGKIAYSPLWLTKAILSDVWLGFRPANWIGNATGATAQLLANDSFTFTPRGNMIDHLARQLGGYLPTPRVITAETGQELSQFSAGAVAETTSGFLAWLGSLGGKYPNSPLARLSRAAYNIPYGNLEIPLGKNLSIPISEQNFALRAFYVPQQRVFRGLVDDSLTTTLQPILQSLNLDPATSKLVLDKIYSLATEGGRTDIVQGLRTWLGKNTFVPSLKSLGVAPETISPNAASRIERLLSDALPEDAPVVLQEIRKILDGERKPVAQLLNVAGVHPGIRDWTDVDLTQEVAWLTSQLTDLPKNIGLDPAQLKQEGKQLAQQVVDARRNSLERFFSDLPAAENNPDLWSLTMDFWTEVFQTKTAARQVVDDSSRRALQAGTPEAWQDKWRITQETYTKLAEDLPEISDRYRLLLDQITNGRQPYTRQYDWWDVLQKRLGFDEEEFRTLRAAGLQGLDLDQGQQLIDANRQYVDNGFWDLFSAFQRYPSIDNFDIVRNTMNRVDAMGAQTAAQAADLRAQLANGLIGKKAYARQTGELWTGYFDAAYHYLNEMTRATIAQGIAPQSATDLRWFDADGTEWRLIGPSNKKGKYLARNPETNRVEEFSRGLSPDETGPFVVPSYVVDDLENLRNAKPGEAVEQVAQQIADSRPPAVRQEPAPMEVPAGMELQAGDAPAMALTPTKTPPKGTQLGPPERVNGYVNGGKAPENFYELLGVEKGTPLKGTLQEWVQKSRQANGQSHTHIGDVAQHQVNTIDNLERTLTNNIDSILGGQPNQLSGGQILRIIDGVNDWLPQWDDALGQSIYVGDQMVGWTMLNFADKRNVDTIMQLLFPFPYFWSRMGPRVAMNGLQKPSFVNLMYETGRGIELENEQSNVPQRLEGTLPVGTNQQGDQYRLGVSNTFKYLMPNYWTPNYYVNEEMPGHSILQYTPSLGPVQQAIADGAIAMKNGTPMPDQQFSDMAPIPGIGIPYTSIPQLMTGEMQPKREGVAGYFANPDEWDPYRARRAVGYIAVEEGIDQATTAYANQVIRNQYEGRPVGEGIPPERLEAAMALARRGVQRGAQERTQNRVTGYTGLMPLYTYPKAEQDMRQAQSEYYASDYDPMTQTGSKALQRQYLEENPALKSWWTKGFDDPGASGRRTDMNTELDAVRQARQAEVDAAIQRNPNVDDQTIYDINNKYYEQEAEIRKKYDVPDLPPSTDPLRGMNPREQATYRLERILNYQPPGKPEYPADGASDAEMQAYYDAKGQWDEQRLQWVESQLAMLSGAEQPYSDMDAEARELLSGQYTTDLLRREQNRYTSDLEYDYWERNALEKEAEAVEWQAREEAVKQALGEQGLKAYRTYMNADDETRAKLREQDSIYTEARELAFNTEQYNQAKELFGDDWFKVYANAPRYPGDNPSDEELQAFYDELSAYKTKNPQYNEIDMWMDGRPLSDTVREGLVQNNGYLPKNYGEDWQQAKQYFGDDIFEIVQGREAAYAKSDEAGKQFYRNLSDDRSRRLAAYDAWRKELREQETWAGYNPPANAQEAQQQGYPYPQDQRQTLDWRTYQGPRPLGSDAQPVVPGEAQSPPGWVRGLGGQPQPEGPAQGPQTPGAGATLPLAEEAGGMAPTGGMQTPDRPRAGGIPTSGWGGLNDILAAEQGPPPQPADPLANVPITDGSGFPTLAQAAAFGQPGAQPAGGTQTPGMGDPSKIGEYAQQNETYQDVQASRQQWESRKTDVYDTFGEDVGGLYEQYIGLPKGQARADFKAQHPELRAVSLYTWNPEEYQYLADTYGQDGIMAWAMTPAWADTDEARKRRNDYYDKNPVAWEINAWLYGRPGGSEAETTDDETFSYNFGADYGMAKELFGDNIWQVVAGYKRGWSKEQKGAYFDQNPQLGDFFDWWYGNLPDNQRTSNSRYYGKGGGRYYNTGKTYYGRGGYSWGGGGGYSWGGGGGGEDEERYMDAYIAPTQVRRANYRVGDMQGYRRRESDAGWQRFMQMFGNGRDWRRTYR